MQTTGLVVFLFFTALPVAQGQRNTVPSEQSLYTGVRQFEVGGQVADIRTDCVGRNSCSLPSFATGIGATGNLNPHFALDADFNITPAYSKEVTNVSGGRASEFLAGVRAEVRARRYGFFLKAQPGYLRWSKVVTQVVYPTPETFSFVFGSTTRFVSNVGAGFEYSPSARIHVRAEVSDLVMHYGGSSWTNNLQPTAGIYAGMGKPIAWTPPVYDAKSAHPFFGSSNLALIMTSELGMTADAITTQQLLKRGGEEEDPFARPLVKYGWSGQISAMALETGGELLVMYGLHRIGQHWVERLVPACLATTHGIFAYNNNNYNMQTNSSTNDSSQ